MRDQSETSVEDGKGDRSGARLPSRRKRIALASDRTMLANERTLAAWMRTAMAAVVAGIAFAKFYEGSAPAWLIKGGASLLIALAILIIGAGFLRYRNTTRRLLIFMVDAPSNLALSVATGLLALAALGAGVALWFL